MASAHLAPEATVAVVSHSDNTLLVPPTLESPAAFVLPEGHAVTVPAVVASAPTAET